MAVKKRVLTQEEQFECAELKSIFQRKKGELGLSQAAVADALGISQSAVNHYLNGKNALNASAASRFAQLLQVPVSDFSHRLAKEINMMSIGIDVEKLKAMGEDALAETTTLQLMDVAGSCGQGVVNPEYPSLLRSIEIPDAALLQLLGTTNLNNVELVSPDGDSMEPTIPRKSIILAKTNTSVFDGSGIYFFTLDGYSYIKRLARGKHGVIKATSDNPAYSGTNFEISPEEFDQLTIHAKLWKVLPLEFLDI